jgi:peptidoglycan DL-endopeptidase CwlO
VSAIILESPERDLAATALWERSRRRSLERRQQAAVGERAPRSLVSAALLDLDGPALYDVLSRGPDRDLSDGELFDLSLALAQAKRRATRRGSLPQARVAGASLVVAALAAALPAPGATHSRARSPRAAHVADRLLRFGSRGPAVARVQRALGVAADGIFGPRTRAAVRAFQRGHGLLVDGIVGPQTRGALFADQSGTRYIRAWWVEPVQRAVHVPVDGLYGPITRAAVRAYQARHGLIVDGIVGPQTLGSLGIGPTGSQGQAGEDATSAHSTRGARAAAVATRYLGVPYRWGGASPSGFDCSGFVMYVFGRVGVSLPHNAAAQYRYGRPVSRGNLAPGDLVFFDGLGHVGIYLRGGRFIHAPHTGDVVKISSIWDSWYASRWVGARRL